MEIINKKPADFSTQLNKLAPGESFVLRQLTFNGDLKVFMKTELKSNDRIKVVDLSNGEVTTMSYDSTIYKVDAKVIVDGYLKA